MGPLPSYQIGHRQSRWLFPSYKLCSSVDNYPATPVLVWVHNSPLLPIRLRVGEDGGEESLPGDPAVAAGSLVILSADVRETPGVQGSHRGSSRQHKYKRLSWCRSSVWPGGDGDLLESGLRYVVVPCLWLCGLSTPPYPSSPLPRNWSPACRGRSWCEGDIYDDM